MPWVGKETQKEHVCQLPRRRGKVGWRWGCVYCGSIHELVSEPRRDGSSQREWRYLPELRLTEHYAGRAVV